jgi:hypothetical protein
MLEDLKALDAMYGEGTDGWYSDSPDQPIYDLYNFYVFPNFPLMWGRIIGERYPQWNEKFHARVKTFLETAPLFFAANGNHPLMGRSLIYRWAVLSPLVLGYREKLWPHSPGLLRRIVRGQLEYHWSLGCFDEQRGKLRETYSAAGTPVTREPYVDNGHPYWTMLGFAFLSIPKEDPFWTDKEEPLPVEKGDYVQRFDGPKFLVSGNKASGEVRWIQAQNSAKRDAYRDKYSKFAWSSHFGFCALKDADKVAPDQALVFRETATGKEATRAPGGVTDGKLLDDGSGVETQWLAQLGEWKLEVTSRVRLLGDFEERTHVVTAPAEAVGKVELLEATYALGDGGKPVDTTEYTTDSNGATIGLWRLAGYDRAERQNLRGANLVNEESYFLTALGPLTSARATFATLTYATPKRPDWDDVERRAAELKKRWKV